MLRAVVNSKFCSKVLAASSPLLPKISARKQSEVATSHGHEETPEEFDRRFVDFFNNPEIDGWFLRKGLSELQHEDVVPEPAIICAALRACRRVDDLGLAIRCLESMRIKCGDKIDELFPYLMQECKPTMDELGIPSLAELGYDKPEFHLPDPAYYWPEEYYKLYNIRQRNINYEYGTHYY